MEKLFKLKEHGTDVKTEIIAGLTTFLAMVYILAVNPSILSASGMDAGAVFTATCVSAAIASACMGFFANYPIALASGMGLNAYFAYTVVPQLAAMGINEPWKVALTAILVEGVIFILLSFFKFRETLVNKVPDNLKYGISAGIGLFIIIVGMNDAGIVVRGGSNLFAMGNIASPQFALSMIGLMIIAVISNLRVPGAILWGILATWILGMGAQAIGWYQVDTANGAYPLLPDFSNGFNISAPYLFQFDFGYVMNNIVEFTVIVFSFLFMDLFDTVGTLIGVANSGLLNEKGELPKAGAALMSDAVGTVAGACLGTSTVTSYVESAAGVAAGGRTGLTAVTAAVLFLVSIVLSPVFLAVPGFATTPALIFVGLLMMQSLRKMKFEGGDIAELTGGFMALVMMPFTCSIANGIVFGILTWVILKVCIGRAKDIHPVMWTASAFFALRIVMLAAGA